MSAKVKLAGVLPGDENVNGLDHIADKMVAHPENLLLCLAWIDVREVKDMTDTGERIPVARVRRIEYVSPAKDAPQELRDMGVRLAEERTGKTPLPFDRVTAETDGPVE